MAGTLASPKAQRAWRLFANAVAIFTLLRAALALRRKGIRGLVKPFVNMLTEGARNIPGVAGALDVALQKEVAQIEKNMLGDGDATAVTAVPELGQTPDEIIDAVSALRSQEVGFESGKKWGGVYHDTRESSERHALHTLQCRLFEIFNHSNALYPGVFPSVRKFEAEVIAMAVDLVHGRACGAVGLLASGGTESILIAVHAYRELARERGIESPQIICCITAHPAIDKACHYFGIELVKIGADAVTQRLPPNAVAAAISRRTIAVYASAPTFPHGVVDPIEELSELCLKRGVGLHVDNCLGGFWLSYMQQQGLGRSFKWDFELPGVTTISIDIHKYGCASKGASVVAFRDNALRRASYVPVQDGNTLYITPTLQGARSGAVIAAAWGTMMHMGRDGYLRLSKRLHELHARLKDAVRDTKGIRLLCDADLSIVPIASDDANINIYSLATLLDKKGWNTFTSSKPSAMAVCIGERHEEVLDVWVNDLHTCLAELRANPNVKPEGDSAVYGTADLLPDQILGDVMRSYVDVKLTVKPRAD